MNGRDAALIAAVAAYSAQILLVVAAAAAAAAVVRAPAPRFRLVFWRIVLLVCLLLPLAPARVITIRVTGGVGTAASVAAATPAAVTGVRSMAPEAVAVWVLIAGMAIRMLWLAIGWLRLGALRRESREADLAGDLADLRRHLAPSSEVRWHERIGQPVTFGFRWPIVLLPSGVRLLAPDVQRAVLCHELLHAARGDWRTTLVEELVGAVFWFHPAIRWVIEQIQLSREETVDAMVVSMTASRRLYMRALLAFSDSAGPIAMPAPSLIHRRHLASRIRQLSREVVMSHGRFVFSAAALAAILAGSVWTAVAALPLRTEVTTRTDARRAGTTDISLPATSRSIQPSSPRGAQSSQNPWQGRTLLPPPPPPPPPPNDGKTNPRVIATVKPDYPGEALAYSPSVNVWVTATLDASGAIAQARATRFQLTIDRSIDDPNYWASRPERPFMEAAEAAALKWKFAPPDANTRTTIELMFSYRNIPSGAGADGSRVDAWPDGHKTMRVGGAIRPPLKIVDAKPVYPDTARAGNVEGVVILDVRISGDGSVEDARVVRSIPMLDDAAIAAVRQWRFEPTLLNGEPVDVVMTVTVDFRL